MTGERLDRTAQRILFPADDDAPASLYLGPASAGVSHGRSWLRLPPGCSASLRTYFAAFPAALWMRVAGARRVTLAGDVQGTAVLRLSVRSAAGVRSTAATVDDGAFAHAIELASDDDWVWVDVQTADAGARLSRMRWELAEARMGSSAVCITTHNRPSDCLALLGALSADDVGEYLDHVIVVDQGDRRLRDAPGFAAVAAALGNRLRLIEQANLGGSGGFSRGMLEAAGLGAENAVLLDDDVRLEPESVRRTIALAARSAEPVIVGAHMLDLLQPTHLHSWGERVDHRRFDWASIDPDLDDVDLGESDITTMPADAQVDFNGWWMCLIPTAAIRRLGAALPYFIKWDDTEFALRAASAGIDTVTLPGAALWHLAWTGKDDGLDWQAYFQLRNRIVTALLHGRARRGAGVLRATFALDVNHVLCMQYGSGRARRLALVDVLRGPAHLDATLARRIADLRALMAEEGQTVVAAGDLPAAGGASAPVRPVGARALFGRLLRVSAHQFRRPTTPVASTVQRGLTRAEGKWWALGLLDSATVESATGTGSFVARRDRTTAATLLRDAVLLRLRLWTVWPRLARAYRDAAPCLAGPDAWASRFAGHEPPARRPSP